METTAARKYLYAKFDQLLRKDLHINCLEWKPKLKEQWKYLTSMLICIPYSVPCLISTSVAISNKSYSFSQSSEYVTFCTVVTSASKINQILHLIIWRSLHIELYFLSTFCWKEQGAQNEPFTVLVHCWKMLFIIFPCWKNSLYCSRIRIMVWLHINSGFSYAQAYIDQIGIIFFTCKLFSY